MSHRRYALLARARRRDATRQRIVEAVVALHAEVGPARTTVMEIAKRAGVSRPTVYTHFPEEQQLISACSAHWLAANRPPDQAAWARIAGGHRRLRVALQAMYAYYARTEGMLAQVVRDAAVMPSVAEAIEQNFGGYLRRAVELLASGLGSAPASKRKVTAALTLALDFRAWQILTAHGRLTTAAAAELMASLVEGAGKKLKGKGKGRSTDTPRS